MQKIRGNTLYNSIFQLDTIFQNYYIFYILKNG